VLAQKHRSVIGIDNNADAIAYARSRYPEPRFLTQDLLDIYLNERLLPLDAVVCLEGIEHLDEGAGVRVVQTFHDLVRPGGMLLISSPNPLSSKSGKKFHRKEYRPTELYNLLVGAGWTVSQAWNQSRNPNLNILPLQDVRFLSYLDTDPMVGFVILLAVKPTQ